MIKIKSDPSVPARSKIILIVEDDPDHMYVASTVLQYSGYSVLEAYNGEDAIEAALAWHPDMVLMDIMLPKMDGFETTRQLKENDKTADISVIALTSIDDIKIKEQAMNSGFDGFLVKPFTPYMVDMEITKILKHKKQQKRFLK